MADHVWYFPMLRNGQKAPQKRCEVCHLWSTPVTRNEPCIDPLPDEAPPTPPTSLRGLNRWR